MKRLLCVLLILCAVPVFALADYSGMSNEELKDEFNLIVAEMVSRGIWISEMLPAGLYVVGETIPAGNYELTPIKRGTVSIYLSVEDMAANHNRVLYLIYDESQPFTLTLIDGMVVDLENGCTVKPFGFSW